jgi:hypothetical protein
VFDIQLTVDQVLQADDIRLTVDDQELPFQINGSVILAQQATQGFVHLLKLQNVTGKNFQIQQASIGGCDLRQQFFLSWMQNHDGSQVQPATEFWQPNQTWVLPFAYPLSGWLEMVERKIPNYMFGQNLFDHWHFYYPQSVQLDPAQFPPMVRDFYQHNVSFSMVPKLNASLDEIPYMHYVDPVSPDLTARALAEIQHNLDYVFEQGLSYGQYSYNVNEFKFEDDATCWRRIWLHQGRAPTQHSERFGSVMP